MCARSSCHSLTDESSRVKEHQIRKENHKKQRDKQSNTVACCVSFTVLCTLHRVCCALLLVVRPKHYLLIGYLILTHPCLPVQRRFDSRSLSVWLAGCSLVPLVHRVLTRWIAIITAPSIALIPDRAIQSFFAPPSPNMRFVLSSMHVPSVSPLATIFGCDALNVIAHFGWCAQ